MKSFAQNQPMVLKNQAMKIIDKHKIYFGARSHMLLPKY